MGRLRQALRADLQSEKQDRRFGSGWISGVFALFFAMAGLVAVLCLRFPDVLTTPMLREHYDVPLVRVALHLDLILGFGLAVLNLALRRQKIMGFTAITGILVATLLGGSQATSAGELTSGAYLGLDWFLLNLTFLCIIFIPLERFFARLPEQSIFRQDWRADLFYFLVNSLLVQSLTYLSLKPALTILANTDWAGLRATMASQPVWLQFIEIMFLTDLVQYGVHRLFHQVPALWRFHAVHHSAKTMDWLAGSRMHLVEIVCLRGFTVIPMYALGYSDPALKAYILYVFLHSTFIHANVRFDFGWLKQVIATPQFHHWHHGIEKEAIDVNFAVHFPILDRIFGTHYLPDKWPSGYGVGGHPVPDGYAKQLMYPFQRG
ncbi:MAG TPA: sterol desaturase family protein [Terriglobales bacterium]|nr:sterol desaturase family protein [Terriglobales bacterium]